MRIASDMPSEEQDLQTMMELREHLPEEVLVSAFTRHPSLTHSLTVVCAAQIKALSEAEQEAYLKKLLAHFRHQEEAERESAGQHHRFSVGDRVVCNTSEGWAPGSVVAVGYRPTREEWPHGGVMPYQVELDDRKGFVFAPRDASDCIRGEREKGPWHVQAGRHMREANINVEYPKIARHKQLFEPSNVDTYFVPKLKAALASWQETGDPCAIDPRDIPGLRIEAPGVISFDCLMGPACDLLLEETKAYGGSGMPQRAPNSMNNYGVVLNEIGMKPRFLLSLAALSLSLSLSLFLSLSLTFCSFKVFLYLSGGGRD